MTFFLLIIYSSFTAAGIERLLAPKAELWAYWQVSNPGSIKQINHQAWDSFLHSHVVIGADGINRLDYVNIDSVDKKQLAQYINVLSATEILQYNREQQFAFWVNLYNAVTVSLILEYHPVKSIRDIDISPGIFSNGPWDKKLIDVSGKRLSLNDIEHRILRPIWRDPRVHYVLNCASIGCPNLPPYAIISEKINEQLNSAAREFINHPRGVEINASGLYVSSIYNWFQNDFGDSEKAVIEHLQQYARPEMSVRLQSLQSIKGYQYNWDLNDTSQK